MITRSITRRIAGAVFFPVFAAGALVATGTPAQAAPPGVHGGLAGYTEDYYYGYFGMRVNRSDTRLVGTLALPSGQYQIDVTAGWATCGKYPSETRCTPAVSTVGLTGSAQRLNKKQLVDHQSKAHLVSGSCDVPVGPADTGWMKCQVSLDGAAPSYVGFSLAVTGGVVTCALDFQGECLQYVVVSAPLDGYYTQT